MGKAAADTDGMDTSTRSAALPCLLCRSPFAAVSLFQLAPPPSSTAAQHRLTAWGLIQCISPCWSSGSPSPVTPRVSTPSRTRRTDQPWSSRARCAPPRRTSPPGSPTVWMSKCWTCGPSTAAASRGSSSWPSGTSVLRPRAPRWRRTTDISFSWTRPPSPWYSRHRTPLWTPVSRSWRRMWRECCARTAVSLRLFLYTCHTLSLHYKGHWSCYGDVRRQSPLSGCACARVVYIMCQRAYTHANDTPILHNPVTHNEMRSMAGNVCVHVWESHS